jgi:hypothetical protein
MLGAIAGWDANDLTNLTAPVPDYLAGLDAGVRGLQSAAKQVIGPLWSRLAARAKTPWRLTRPLGGLEASDAVGRAWKPSGAGLQSR